MKWPFVKRAHHEAVARQKQREVDTCRADFVRVITQRDEADRLVEGLEADLTAMKELSAPVSLEQMKAVFAGASKELWLKAVMRLIAEHTADHQGDQRKARGEDAIRATGAIHALMDLRDDMLKLARKAEADAVQT